MKPGACFCLMLQHEGAMASTNRSLADNACPVPSQSKNSHNHIHDSRYMYCQAPFLTPLQKCSMQSHD